MRGFREAFESNEFLVTAEIAPPKGADMEPFLAAARTLKGKAHAINVTDNQRAITRLSAVAASAVLVQNGMEPICQIACRDKNRIALQSDILGLWALGVRSVLGLTGDSVRSGDNKEAKPVFDLEAVKLIRLIDQLNKGINVDGKELKGKTDFLIGAAVDPNHYGPKPFEMRFEQKIASGARFFQTQPIFNEEKLEAFMKYVEPFKVKVLLGILLLRSAKQAHFLNSKVPGIKISEQIISKLESSPNPLEVGIDYAASLVQRYKKIAPGVHIMTVGHEELHAEVIRRSGL
ncbi:MAG: methylenetetrahydrofolate reductase [Deltaproteobacteria bacterium]|nr:methylenetetrahydrofolate reductase [Deltaproteobacteria bacterium]